MRRGLVTRNFQQENDSSPRTILTVRAGDVNSLFCVALFKNFHHCTGPPEGRTRAFSSIRGIVHNLADILISCSSESSK